MITVIKWFMLIGTIAFSMGLVAMMATKMVEKSAKLMVVAIWVGLVLGTYRWWN